MSATFSFQVHRQVSRVIGPCPMAAYMLYITKPTQLHYQK